MVYLILLFVIAGILLVIFGAWDLINSKLQIRQRLPAQDLPQRKKAELARYLTPFFRISNLVLNKFNLKEKISQKLYAARINLNATEFLSLKAVIMVGLVILAYFIYKELIPLLALAAFVLGYILPEVWLTKRIAKRKQSIARILPETIDLLGLCMEAGLDFTMSMEWIVKKTRSNPMIEELSFVLEEIKWGKPRVQALKDMSKRLDFPEIRSFVHTLSQAERMGTPVVEVLTMLSEDTRMQRAQRGERIALKAPLKMLIPLIFCILPVIGIVVAGPILIQFMSDKMF